MDYLETLTMSDLSLSNLLFSKRMYAPKSFVATGLGLLLASALLTPAAMAQETGQRPTRRAPAEGPRIWWNQPRFVEGLALTDEQRGGMDKVLEFHLEARRGKGRSYQQARAEVTRAAQAGDWQAAEAANAQIGEAAAELAHLEGRLIIDVLRLLTVEQRAKLQADFPMILLRPWLFGGRGFGLGAPGRSGRAESHGSPHPIEE